MVTKSLTENAEVPVGVASKNMVPSLESVVSSIDEDSQVQGVKEDKRDDTSALGLTNKLLVDYGCLGESRNDLLALEEVRAESSTPGTCNDKATAGSPLKSTPSQGAASTRTTDEEQDTLFFESLCAQPYDMFVKATTEAACENPQQQTNSVAIKTKQMDGITDDEVSVASVGKLFDDLASIPSLASIGVKLSLIDNEQDTDSLLAAVEDLTLTSDTQKEKSSTETSKSTEVPKAQPLNERISSIDSVHLEKTLDKKLNETIEEGKAQSDQEIVSESSYSGSKRGSFSPTEHMSCHTEWTGLTDEQPPTEALVKQLRNAREQYGRYDVNCAKLTASLGDVLYKNGDYEKAFAMYKDAMSVYSTKLGDSNVTTIECRIHIGETLEKLGKIDAAIQEYHAVFEMRKDLNGEKDSTVADALVMISRALRQKEGRVPHALKELKKALKLYRTSLGDADPTVAATVDDIASLYMMSGNFAKAAAILDEVVKLKATTSGMCSTDVADTLTQLALAQHSSGNSENALKSLKKAYSIYTSVNGEDSKETIASLEKLARFYMETNDYNKAINACMGVLNRKKRTLGNSDPSLADTYLDLGVCLQQTGDFNKASKCLKLALTLCIGLKNTDGMRDSGTIAHIMHQLGVIHQLNGRTKDAVKVFKQELVVRRKMGPEELPQVARTLFYLGTAKYDLGEYAKALSFLTEALGIYEQIEEDLGMDFAETLFSTGLVFKTTKHDERARHAFLESLKLFYAHGLPNDHELVKMATTKLIELGHECKCQYRVCTQVPCQSTYVDI